MTIKNKLTALIIFIIASIATMYGLLHFALEDATALKDAENQVSQLEGQMLLLRRHEKDFLARDDEKYLKKFEVTHADFIQRLDKLDQLLEIYNVPNSKSAELHTVMEQYTQHFYQLAALKKEIGLSHEKGLRGTLRKAVQSAEKSIKEVQNYELLADILQLRRNEKDFLIRKDLKYRDKFEKNFSTLITATDTLLLDDVFKQETQNRLNTYRTDFLNLISNYQALGLSSKEGLKGKMRATIHQTEMLFAEQSSTIKTSLTDQINNMLMFATIKALIIAAIVTIIALLIARSVISPLNNLSKVMGRARDEKDLTLRFSSTAKDEIAQMGMSFNSMMEEFQLLLNKVNDSSVQLSSAAEQVSTIAQDTSGGLDQQKAEVIQVSSAVQEMETAMHEISNNTDLTAQTANNAQQSASEGQTIISHAIQNITDLAKDASNSSNAVVLLTENSNKISTVLDVIKAIAEQTNLLALNASIEAARAGDHGRGFSVVADEVRGLAGRSQESAAEIEVMINDLQQQTELVSSLMNRSVELSNRSAEEASGSINALDQITNDATHIVDMTTQVASAVEEQTAVASEIKHNAERIQAIVEVANEQVSQNAIASEEVAKQANYLQQIVGQFKVT
jgi:methyl-accepting chemotaxis protein